MIIDNLEVYNIILPTMHIEEHEARKIIQEKHSQDNGWIMCVSREGMIIFKKIGDSIVRLEGQDYLDFKKKYEENL